MKDIYTIRLQNSNFFLLFSEGAKRRKREPHVWSACEAREPRTPYSISFEYWRRHSRLTVLQSYSFTLFPFSARPELFWYHQQELTMNDAKKHLYWSGWKFYLIMRLSSSNPASTQQQSEIWLPTPYWSRSSTKIRVVFILIWLLFSRSRISVSNVIRMSRSYFKSTGLLN